MAQVKCRYCGKLIDRDNAYKVGKSSYYCNETHYLNKQDESRNDIKYKPQQGSSRRALTDFIQNEIYIKNGWNKKSINWNLLMQQVKSLQDKFGYKYSGILLTLKYLMDIKGMNLLNESNGNCLGLVEYYYDEAKQNYLETQAIKKEIENFDFNDNIKVIKKSIDNNNKKWYNKVKIEDLI